MPTKKIVCSKDLCLHLATTRFLFNLFAFCREGERGAWDLFRRGGANKKPYTRGNLKVKLTAKLKINANCTLRYVIPYARAISFFLMGGLIVPPSLEGPWICTKPYVLSVVHTSFYEGQVCFWFSFAKNKLSHSRTFQTNITVFFSLFSVWQLDFWFHWIVLLGNFIVLKYFDRGDRDSPNLDWFSYLQSARIW